MCVYVHSHRFLCAWERCVICQEGAVIVYETALFDDASFRL